MCDTGSNVPSRDVAADRSARPMTKDIGATVKVTDAGRDEIARPARGISVGQRRLLQGLDIHGSTSRAIAADKVLQRRPLQGDLDRLTTLGLIAAEGVASVDIAVATDAERAVVEVLRPENPVLRGTAASKPIRGLIAASVGAVMAFAALVIYMNSKSGADAKSDSAATSSVSGAPAAEKEAIPASVVVPTLAEAPPVASARADTRTVPAASPRPEVTPAPRKEPAEANRPSVAAAVVEKPAATAPGAVKSEPPAPQVLSQVLPRIPPTIKPSPVAASVISTPPDVKQAEAPRPAPTRKNASLAPGDGCSKLDYPSLALRAEQSGTVVLNFLVDVDGRVADSKIDNSSGYRLLDEAARKGLSRCRFVPATVDGRPEQAWTRVEYVWRIEGN
jgi:protein TonB